MNLKRLVFYTLVSCGLGVPAIGQSKGAGWTVTRIDLEVDVQMDEQRVEYGGTVYLRLDHTEPSDGPTLYLNARRNGAGDPVLRFTEVECEGAEVRAHGLKSAATERADVRFGERKSRGDEIEVRFAAASAGLASQVIVHEQMAIVSWTSAWLPFTLKSSTAGVRFTASVAQVPGRTRLHLPPTWIGIVDGMLHERRQTDSGTVEIWETPEGVARGFAAGPYTAVTERVDGREVHVYMLSEDKPLDAPRLARLIADTMAAQEARLWPRVLATKSRTSGKPRRNSSPPSLVPTEFAASSLTSLCFSATDPSFSRSVERSRYGLSIRGTRSFGSTNPGNQALPNST